MGIGKHAKEGPLGQEPPLALGLPSADDHGPSGALPGACRRDWAGAGSAGHGREQAAIGGVEPALDRCVPIFVDECQVVGRIFGKLKV